MILNLTIEKEIYMDILKRFFMTAVLLVSTSAFANNGVEFYEFDFYDGRVYVECLDQEVDIHQYVTGTYHEFETPSGNYHLLDNWRITLTWTGFVPGSGGAEPDEGEGVTTGDTWVGRNVSPFQLNIGPGETNQFVYKGVQKPLTGDGPMFFYGTEFKVTVNANGDLVVERLPEEPFSDRVRCLGKK
jgi:hypothetical protein